MNNKIAAIGTAMLLIAILLASCKKESCPDDNNWVYDPTVYLFEKPTGFPPSVSLNDINLTEEGIQLGRMLFYDPILSGDSTQACAGCHNQSRAFTDNGKRFSVGIDGNEGARNAMPLFNLAWSSAFFWDGRASSLEEQSQMPVVDPLEMHGNWPENIERLQNHTKYPELFYGAFGIQPDDISPSYAGKALEQFMLTIISASSKADKILSGDRTLEFSQSEMRGIELFNDPNGADCFHCHGTISLNGSGNNLVFMDINPSGQFRNNGLQDAATINDLADPGKGAITGNPLEYGKMKVPSLRNLAYTAPYMHDGRFQTLDEVLDFYSTGLHPSPNIDPNMEFALTGGVALTLQEKEDLKAFLMTLNDEEFLTNPAYSNPFE